MAISNREKQKRFREFRAQSGASRISCWLPEEDNRRLRRLMEMLSYSNERKSDYADVISRALKEMEINLSPAGTKNMVRYGLFFLNDQAKK